MIEIERKFLVNNEDFLNEATSKIYIKQGFLSTHPKRTVRIRITNNQGFITIKGASSKDGTSRMEWEKEIALVEAQNLLNICKKGVIEKYRYLIPNENFTFEVDVFEGKNKGLIVAELELPTKNTSFKKPKWLGEEVTGQVKYYNAQLSKKPFNSWK